MKGVYGILNKQTGKLYIGSSCNVDQRINHHLSSLRRGTHHCKSLQADWDGNERRFMFIMLEVCRRNADVLSRERYWQKRLAKVSYNTTR